MNTQSVFSPTNCICSCGGNLVTTRSDVVYPQCALVQDHQKITTNFDIISHTYPLCKSDPKLLSLHRFSKLLETTTTTERSAGFLVKRVYPALKNNFSSGEIVTASIYLVLRHKRENIPLVQLIDVSRVLWTRITRKKVLKCASAIRALTHIAISPVKTNEYFPVIIGKVVNGEGFKYEQEAKHILKRIPTQIIRGKNPYILAGAITYAVSRKLSLKKISQKHLAEKMNVSPASIACTYYNLIKPIIDNGG